MGGREFVDAMGTLILDECSDGLLLARRRFDANDCRAERGRLRGQATRVLG